MSLNTRIAELTEKHRTLERKIAEEMTRPAADPVKITKWKHEKLRLKDELQRLEQPTRH
jgi:hypothetical protein